MEENKKENIIEAKVAQEVLVTAGQRRINLIWEITQAIIALFVTGSMVFCIVTGRVTEALTNAFFLIIGFYFSRTNHTKTGGVDRYSETR